MHPFISDFSFIFISLRIKKNYHHKVFCAKHFWSCAFHKQFYSNFENFILLPISTLFLDICERWCLCLFLTIFFFFCAHLTKKKNCFCRPKQVEIALKCILSNNVIILLLSIIWRLYFRQFMFTFSWVMYIDTHNFCSLYSFLSLGRFCFLPVLWHNTEKACFFWRLRGSFLCVLKTILWGSGKVKNSRQILPSLAFHNKA